MSACGVKKLKFNPRHCQLSTNINILEQSSPASIAILYPNKQFIFQQKGASCHRSWIVKQWFEGKTMTLLTCPVNSQKYLKNNEKPAPKTARNLKYNHFR